MKRADAWVLTIGDELLRGEIVDSNKSFLSERLLHLDLVAERHISVPDEPEAIREVLREAAARARVVLVSGGLGPTRDDLTTEVAASAFGRRLLRDTATVERLRAYFASVGREMSENNAKQADFPEGAEILPNPLGTAPGFALEAEGAHLFFMPGVPRELYRMADEEVLPRIERALARGGAVRARLLRTFGLGESILDRELSDLARGDADVLLGFRTQFPDNLVRVVARAPSAALAEAKLEGLVAEVRRRLGDVVVGEGERPLAEIVGALLLEHKRTIALAESCTGGLLASRLTDVPGSSGYLLEAAVTYSDRAKVRALGVSPAALAAHGAVSEPVARQMAEGVRERAGADIGMGITGIAGPTGGTPDKPVGTVYVAYADGSGSEVRRYQLMRERARNKELTAQIALDWIRRRLLGLPVPDESFPRLRAAPGRAS